MAGIVHTLKESVSTWERKKDISEDKKSFYICKDKSTHAPHPQHIMAP